MSFDAVYRMIKKRVRGDVKRRTMDSTSSIAFFFGYDQKGLFTYHKPFYPCYGWTGRSTEIPPGSVYLVTHIHQVVLREDIENNWISYILHESPYRGVLNSVEEIIKNRLVIADIQKIPSNEVYAALFSLRMVYERPTMIEFWYELVSQGVPKDVAFLMTHSFSFSGAGKTRASVKMLPGACLYNDHMAICLLNRQKTYLRNFLSKTKVVLEGPIIDMPSILSVWSIFGAEETKMGRHEDSFVYKFWEGKLLNNAASRNPFISANNKIPYVDYEQALNLCVVNWPCFKESILND